MAVSPTSSELYCSPVKYEYDSSQLFKKTSATSLNSKEDEWSQAAEKNNVSTFASETTLHGLHHWMGGSRKGATRFFYCLIWCLFAALAGLQLHTTITEYLQYNKLMTMQTVDADVLSFPGVTICPESMLKRSVTGGSNTILKLVKPYYAYYKSQEWNDANDFRECWDETVNDTFPKGCP